VSKKTAAGIIRLYGVFCEVLEKYLVLATVLGFIAGIYTGKYSAEITDVMNTLISGLVDGYNIVAPGVIFIILAPSLTRMFLTRRESRFGGYVMEWYLFRKLLACFWAILFTVAVFRFPLLPERNPSFLHALQQTLNSLATMALHSSYFWAMYLSVAVAYMSTKVRILFRALDNVLGSLESAARYFLPLIPLFMIAIGAYIYGLPAHLNDQIQLNEKMGAELHVLSLFGTRLDPNDPMQMVYIYILGSVLTGIACFLWHLTLVYIANKRVGAFSIKQYFSGYWIKIYPLLWSTSSESIATPLNLYLTKKYAPWVKGSVRRFVIGIGSYMNVNGTLICIYVLGGVVLKILEVNVSFVEWVMTIPVVVLISYGVPGIPGELVMFAGPLATLLNLPKEIYPAFLAIYLGIQIGLPDSFRTGNNSTDDYLCSIIIDDIYKQKFKKGADGDAQT
jgi:Na+/H+-dicarboxylate symporter